MPPRTLGEGVRTSYKPVVEHHEPEPAPPLQSWWFYTSPIPLDDPLAPVPQAGAPSSTKYQPRPFSKRDTLALENAYQELRKVAQDGPRKPPPKRQMSNSTLAYLGRPTISRSSTQISLVDGQQEHAQEGTTRLKIGETDKKVTGAGVVIDLTKDEFSRSPSPVVVVGTPTRTENIAGGSTMMGTRRFSPTRHPSVPPSPTTPSIAPSTPTRTASNPFERFPSPSPFASARRPLDRSPQRTPADNASRKRRAPSPESETSKSPPGEEKREEREVLVGIQRLHKVVLPTLTMLPVYWDPIGHTAPVIRGTWFYRDSMLPVEADIANRLEQGYNELRVWSEEWKAEINSALEVGREGEEKIRWPLFEKPSRPSTNSTQGGGVSEMQGVESTSIGKRETGGTVAAPPLTESLVAESINSTSASWAGPNDWVIYADAQTAFVGRDSLLSFGNKRPLLSIKRGKSVGTAVVRGFDADRWVQLKPKDASLYITPTPDVVSAEPQLFRSMSESFHSQHSHLSRKDSLERDIANKSSHVTDLVLVIHGIGQKLSEKYESFHFTHAVNSFRRLVNMELQEESVKPTLRPELGGVMVLPVNWRSKVSFEDGTPAPDQVPEQNKFNLNDITPKSILAVREFVGDVLMDIPYYLSHHKKKIVKAVSNEANRVFRLWCEHNPHFLENGGRVHIIAHSLGSAIALDILSHQPDPSSTLDVQVDFRGRRMPSSSSLKHVPADEKFDFDTHNLFTCGSPGGFFLLLNKSVLLPRKGRLRADGQVVPEGIGGEAGHYGCLAVDNVYNVLHMSDPIAYRLNPTVDVEYASSLKTAFVPSAQKTFLSSLRSVLPIAQGPIPRLPPPINRLPSTVELETHNFSREEYAEKRMYLLNDNGQIDYFLAAGSGTLENQYLNMLGSHSSYWYNRDFARMVVLEVGRPVGREGCVQAMGAVKNRAVRVT